MTLRLDDPDLWLGEDFELVVRLERELLPDAFERANAAVWSKPWLDGPYAFRGQLAEDERPEKADPAWPESFGVATLFDGSQAPCGSHWQTRWQSDREFGEWFSFFVPGGALEALGMSMDHPGTGRWAEPLSAMYAELACAIHAATPIRVALIGAEVLGDAEPDVTEMGAVPAIRRNLAMLVPEGPSQLRWHPATEWW